MRRIAVTSAEAAGQKGTERAIMMEAQAERKSSDKTTVLKLITRRMEADKSTRVVDYSLKLGTYG